MQDFNRAHFDKFARDFYAQQRKAEQWQRHKSQYHNANYEDFSRNYDALKNNQSMRANTGIGWLDNPANWLAYDNSFTSGVTDTAATWLAGGARLLGDLGDSLKDIGSRAGVQPLNGEGSQALKDFANRADEVKRQVRINHDINRGDSGFSNFVYGAGRVAPEMLFPAGQITMGTGLAGNALRGAGYGALGGGLTSALDSDQSWEQALGGAAIGAGAGGLLGGAGASLLGKFTGHGFSNSPKAGLLNSTIDDAGNIKVDPIVGATNASDDAIARAMNAQQTQPRWQTTEQMPQQMVGQPHWYPNAQTQAQAGMDNVHVNPNANDVQMSVKPQLQDFTPDQLHSLQEMAKWDMKSNNPNQKISYGAVSVNEAAQLRKEFGINEKVPLEREIRANEVQHAFKQHGNPETESRRGQIAIEAQDIVKYYPSITQNYDYRAPTNNRSVIYVKQINGHFIAIEEVLETGTIKFKSAWKTKGNFNKEVLFKNAKYIESRPRNAMHEQQEITTSQVEHSLTMPETLADNANPTTQNLNNSLQSNTFARNLAHQAATNGIAGTAGGIANVALDDSDDSLALKFAKGFALGVATRVAAKHGMNAGAKASKQAFEFAMHKSAQFSTLLRENPQLFTRFLNKQLTDDFAQFGGARSGLHAECFAVAETLSKKGVSAEEILSRTGWFKGLDGEWKIQLDLRGGAAYKLKDGTYNLSQLFKQDSLYAAYPFLRKVRVEIAKLPENVQGSFEPTTGIITLNSANNKLDFTKALAHELQHVIQKYEGFAQGSSTKNPNYWTSAGEVEARATFKNGEDNPIRRLENEKAEGALIETTSKGTSDLEIPNSATLRHSQKLNIEMAQKDMILLKELAQQPLDIQKEMIRKWNVQEMRVNIEKSFNVQPLKEFGTNYAEYMRDGEGAINKLLNEKQGQVSGAFYREDLQKLSGNGNIDLVWGEITDASKHKGYGLAHILDKHPDFDVHWIPKIIEQGHIEKTHNGFNVICDDYLVGVNKGFKINGETMGDNNFVVTAFENLKREGNSKTASATDSTKGASLPSTSKPNPTTQTIKNNLDNDVQHSLQSPLDSLKSAQGRINGLVAFAKYLANPPAHLRGDAQRLRADKAAMRELDMHTRQALTDKANAIDALAYQSGYPEPQYSMKNPRQKQKFAADSVGILQQIRAKSREGMEKIMRNSWVNGALGTRIYGENFADYRFMKDVFDKDIAANSSQALALHNKLKLLSEDAQRKMHHYMVGDTKGEDLSSELKALADSFRKEVRKETDELVKLGLLDKATAEKWGDVYLLREYSTRMVDKLKRAIKGLASEDYGIGLDTIHMRGKKQKVSAKTYQEMLQKGEIGDITKGKWEVLQEPSKHEPHYILRRDYTRSEREKMGEIDLISYSLPRTLAKIQNQKRIATLFSAISKESDLAQKLEAGKEIPSGFRRLNGEQYGALKGFVVRNEVADDIERTTNKILGESKEILKQIAGFATYWKKTKTVHNPTSHLNNMVGNVFFLGMEGNVKGIANAFAAVKNGLPQNIARYEELCAKRGIVNLTQSEASELAKLDTQDMRLYKTLKDRGVFDKSSLNLVLNDYLREAGILEQQSKTTNAAINAYRWIDSRLSRIYGAEDHIFRFGSVKSLLEAGHSLNEAIDITNKVIPDYSKPMPKWLDNAARYGVLPFVQFTYHATPIMMRQLNPLAKNAKGEWNKALAIKKLATMAALFSAYQGLVEYFAEGEMPQGFNAKEVPVWRYRNGDVQTVRIGAAVPHLALADWLPLSSKNGILPENIRTTAIGGIPQWGYYAATDKNAYYDRPITSRKDGWRHYDRGKYVAQQFLPEWFNKGFNLAEAGLKDEQKRKKSNVLNERSGFESALGLAGINTKSYNLHQLRLENERKKQLQSLK